MARPKVKLDTEGMGDALSSSGMRAALKSEADQLASRARSTAPVDTGAYRAGIHVVSDTWRRGAAHYAIERVVAGDGKSMLVESRTGNLKRALRG